MAVETSSVPAPKRRTRSTAKVRMYSEVGRKRRRRRATAGWLLISPTIVLIAIFYVVPMIMLVVMSFFNWPMFGSPKPVGFSNYDEALHDPAFAQSLWFTLKYTIILVPLSLVVAYFMAMLVRSNRKGTGFFRTAFFLPVAIGFAAASYMCSVLFTPGVGFVNVVLEDLGITNGQTQWLADPTSAFWIVVGLTIWKSSGTSMILLMAGMQSIEPEIYEAASLDGAGWWKRETRITLPLIKGTSVMCLLMATAGTFLTFDQFYTLTKGGPGGETMTAVLYNYTVSFIQYRLGYGAAISVLISIIILAVTVFQLRSMSSKKKEAR